MKISKVKATKAASKTTVKPPVTQRRDGTPSRKRSVAEAKTPAPLTVPWDKNLRNLLFGKWKGEIRESFLGEEIGIPRLEDFFWEKIGCLWKNQQWMQWAKICLVGLERHCLFGESENHGGMDHLLTATFHRLLGGQYAGWLLGLFR